MAARSELQPAQSLSGDRSSGASPSNKDDASAPSDGVHGDEAPPRKGAVREGEQDQDQDQDQEQRKGQGKGNREGRRSLWAVTKALWAKAGLDVPTIKFMAKGALAPTIALAAYQSTAFANEFTTLGYLVAIISILSLPIMPRAKFIQSLITNVITTCLATAVALLAIYCCVQARKHTTAAGASTSAYNSSASAVAGIWLFFQIYVVNTIRARSPQFVLPGVILCIFANVSMVYAPEFATMTAGISFAKRLLKSFLTGLAIGAGVSFFVFPMTVRGIVFKEMTGYIMTIRKLMGANLKYLQSLEQADMLTPPEPDQQAPARSPEAQAIKAISAGLAALHGKLSVDLTFAKREVAVGKLGPDDLQETFRLLRALLLPLNGLCSVVDVFDRVSESFGTPGDDVEKDNRRLQSIEEWHGIMKILRDPFARIVGDIDEGLQHVLYSLRLAKPTKTKNATSEDVEARGDQSRPGEERFAEYYSKRLDRFGSNKKDLAEHLAKLLGFDLPADFFDRPMTASFAAPEWYRLAPTSTARSRYRRQLYLVLFMDFLLDSIGHSVLNLVQFADTKVQSGTMSRNRLLLPGFKRTRKWIMTSFSRKEDAYSDDQDGMNQDAGNNIFLGEAFAKRKDPEHLPPTNAWQRWGDSLRSVPHFLRSPESVFGFRVACATMCLAIIAYLRQTETFYVSNRLFWAQIMVTISMTPSAGQSLFSFCLRILGTLSAMTSSFIIYYIVDQKPAGVLVFFWFFCMWGFYIVMKYPKYIPVGMVFSVTNTLIIGYELQTKKIGIAVSTSNGQTYYPLYELAPYRLATVCCGLLVAFIWTIIPWPISEHTQLRKDLGSSLYLLANYYSIVYETVSSRIRGPSGSARDKHSPEGRLEKARVKVFTKSMLMLQGLRTHAAFVKFDVPIGGRFPLATYNKIIAQVQDIVNFISLLSYASQSFVDMWQTDDTADSESKWLRDFRRVLLDAEVTSREITTLLALLSASLASGQPLPPYLKPPEPYLLTAKLDATDEDILSIRHIAEPGYAVFAVMQISTRCIVDDVGILLQNVKELVGELDFSFQVITNKDASRSGLITEDGKNKHD